MKKGPGTHEVVEEAKAKEVKICETPQNEERLQEVRSELLRVFSSIFIIAVTQPATFPSFTLPCQPATVLDALEGVLLSQKLLCLD